MFKPIKNKYTTTTLGAPPNWNEAERGPCVGLPVHKYEGGFHSYWSIPFGDRIAILFGAPVRLTVAGAAHPPVSMCATSN